MFGKKKKTEKHDHNLDMAGPHTWRKNIRYQVPLPVRGAPVYFGDQAYQEKHRNGFSEEELQTAIEQAKRDFDPSSPGKGRVQDWSRGVPSRNRQGVVDELDGISTSAPTTHPKR